MIPRTYTTHHRVALEKLVRDVFRNAWRMTRLLLSIQRPNPVLQRIATAVRFRALADGASASFAAKCAWLGDLGVVPPLCRGVSRSRLSSANTTYSRVTLV